MADHHDHPFKAGVFLALVLAAVGYGVVYKLQHPSAAKSSGHGEKGEGGGEHAATPAEQIVEAIELGQSGDLEGAVRILDGIVKADPNNLEARYNLGIALAGMDRLDEADFAFARLLEKDPQDWEAIAERAAIRAVRGQTADAFKLLDQIPAGQGGLTTRLDSDPRWVPHGQDERMNPIRARHGLKPIEREARHPAVGTEEPSVAQHTDSPVDIAPREPKSDPPKKPKP
ncbi:MAG: tetratricopeptide repeat protein [Deltaproteobacteria bacterium]|nr:tetratricopeptide repeat protein [Deltaproteobacteria bacterium]